MKQELDRVKSDVETIQKAMGLSPSFRREWIQWMKRDNLFNLWWCLPGAIILASAAIPINRTHKYLGLVLEQWTGIFVSITLLAIALGYHRQTLGRDGRPDDMVRETKRLYGLSRHGFWFSLAVGVQLLAYYIWGLQHDVPFESAWAGLFLLLGSTFLVAAVCSKTWVLLGYALPFMGYGLCLPLANGHHPMSQILLGVMFMAIAISFSTIQVWEMWRIKHEDPA